MISFRYGVKSRLLLMRSFEDVARLFTTHPPRIIHLARGDIFCTKIGDHLFSVKWDYNADGTPFIKRMEWRLDGEEPKSVAEALRRLNEYAEKNNRWIVFREILREATAYEVYPEQ